MNVALNPTWSPAMLRILSASIDELAELENPR
jgi:hypothetical protein